jgi:cyclic pyranopterin monophosphate synthase
VSRKSATRAEWSHLDGHGAVQMVNVGRKPIQRRRAVAVGHLICRRATIAALKAKALPKGDVLTVAQIAGIQGVKRCADLIPLCHPLPLEQIDVRLRVRTDRIEVRCGVEARARTGVEMEALAGVCVAALALYDMCKAVDRTMRIGGIRVTEKVKR